MLRQRTQWRTTPHPFVGPPLARLAPRVRPWHRVRWHHGPYVGYPTTRCGARPWARDLQSTPTAGRPAAGSRQRDGEWPLASCIHTDDESMTDQNGPAQSSAAPSLCTVANPLMTTSGHGVPRAGPQTGHIMAAPRSSTSANLYVHRRPRFQWAGRPRDPVTACQGEQRYEGPPVVGRRPPLQWRSHVQAYVARWASSASLACNPSQAKN